MKMRRQISITLGAIAVFIAFGLFGTNLFAQTVPQIIQNPFSIFQEWLPVLGIAIMLSFAFCAILYMLGKLLNDTGISARAISEFGQAIGTAIFAVLAIGILLFFGSFLSSTNVLTGGLGADVGSMCASLKLSQLTILSQNPTAQICNFVTSTQSSGSTDATAYLNYGLASSYIVVANLTNQAANNINSLYVYEGLIGFLSTLVSDPGVCEPSTTPIALSENCVNPLNQRWLSIDFATTPFAGYNLISIMTRPLENQSIFVFYMLLTQLVVYFILISIWPFLLAAGIIMRALPFTRATGGLLMGLTLVIVIILPLVLTIEYNALGHGLTLNQIAGNATQIQDNVIYGLKSSTSTISIYWGDGFSSPMQSPSFSQYLTHTYSKNTQTSTPYTITVDLQSNGKQYSASQSITVPQTSAPKQLTGNTTFYLAKPTINDYTVTICPAGEAGICNAYDPLVPNFYVFPDIQTVINYNGCWPVGGDLRAEETADSLKMATVGVVGIFPLLSGFVSGVPYVQQSIARCTPNGAVNTVFNLMSIYGLMSVVGFMLPLINILIVISAIKNVSYIFGGDTDIAGLGKLV